MTNEERELINKLISDFSNGDKDAYEEFYKKFYNYYLTFIKLKIKGEQADDLAQQLFFKIYTLDFSKVAFKNMSAYFFTMANNMVLNHISACARKKEVELTEDIPYDENFEAFIFRDMILKLTKQERSLLELRYGDGYNLDEVAKLLGVSVSTILRRTDIIKDKLLRTKSKWLLSVVLIMLLSIRI